MDLKKRDKNQFEAAYATDDDDVDDVDNQKKCVCF